MRVSGLLGAICALLVSILGIGWSPAALIDRPAAAPVGGDSARGAGRASLCLDCHHPGQTSRLVPILEAQPFDYLFGQLQSFRGRHRANRDMALATEALTVVDMRHIARYFAGQLPRRAPVRPDIERSALGSQRVSVLGCASCHGLLFSGSGNVPRLAGQYPEFIVHELERINQGRRNHPDVAGMRELKPEDRAAIAQFLAEL